MAAKHGLSVAQITDYWMHQKCCSYGMQEVIHAYCVGQGKERRDEVAVRNGEVGHINTLKEGKLAGTSAEDAIRKISQATLCFQPIGRRDSGRPRRRWLDV
jgi:hypothetical protein